MVEGKRPSLEEMKPGSETIVCGNCFHKYVPVCPLCNHEEGEIDSGDEIDNKG